MDNSFMTHKDILVNCASELCIDLDLHWLWMNGIDIDIVIDGFMLAVCVNIILRQHCEQSSVSNDSI